MTKPTSKSASASKKTSSRYGTSAPTGATGKSKKPRKNPKKFVVVVNQAEPSGTLKVVSEKAKSMTPAEFRKSLLMAGIIGVNGKLTSNYVSKKKEKNKQKKDPSGGKKSVSSSGSMSTV